MVNMASYLVCNFLLYQYGYGISADIKKMTNIRISTNVVLPFYGIPGMFIPLMEITLSMPMKDSKKLLNTSALVKTRLESVTYRWLGHSSSDPWKHRTREEVEEWKIQKTFASISLKMRLRAKKIRSKKQSKRSSGSFSEICGRKPIPLHSNQLSKIFTQTKGSRELWN